jgi:hypothetical protein
MSGIVREGRRRSAPRFVSMFFRIAAVSPSPA